MPRQPRPTENQVSLKFGAGLNSRASESEIDPVECADGQNFSLDIENTLFERRKPFDLVATAPNSQAIKGYAQLKKQSGEVSTLIQAGSTLYEWDGSSGFTSVGTVASGARIRGGLTQNFTLDDLTIITDLSLRQPVSTWDGTTFAEMSHSLSGKFFAKYCWVDLERAIYANIKTTNNTPHLVVFSASEDYDSLSISDRPSSSLSESDPVFLPIPDLRPINGLVSAFDSVVISTRDGQIHKITGSSAQDFALDDLYPNSSAAGDEAIVYIGNDIMYGRPGRLETLFAAEQLGDVETDDLSRQIADLVKDVNDWLLCYDQINQRVYCWDRERSQIFVFHKAFVDERIRQVLQRRDPALLSPWSVWRTDHPNGFQTQLSMCMLNPSSGIPTNYFGGSSGEIFKFEGGGGQDGGTTDLTASRTSRAFTPELSGPIFDVDGFIRYRKIFPATVTLTLLYGGEVLEDQSITVTLPSAENLPVYGGGLYYNDGNYYSARFKGRFSIQNWGVPGRGSEFQIRVSVTGSSDFFIEEVIAFFKAA